MTRRLRILALEPYGALSHRLFLEGLAEHSRHDFRYDLMPARKWKWRMRTSALHFAQSLRAGGPVDLLFVSDYVNLAELLPLLPSNLREVPAVVYFHENQLTYPLQRSEERDYHFALTHVYAILSARVSVFNSHYHRDEFLGALPSLLRLVPDVRIDGIVERISEKSRVLPLGSDVPIQSPRSLTSGEAPVVLWNHRWEYDKNPGALLDGLLTLQEQGVDFRLRTLGERFRTLPEEFLELGKRLADRVDDYGFLPDRQAYWSAVSGCHVVVSTAIHEFFGLGTLEAMRAGCYPVLPDDLAYRELIPPGLREPGLFLYPRAEGIAPTLARALDSVREDHHRTRRQQLIDSTERFSWSNLAPEYDQLFEELTNYDRVGRPGVSPR